PLDLSDAVMARPALVAIFDSVKHEIVLIAAAYPDTATDPDQAYTAAEARLEDFEDRLRGPLPIQREVEPVPAPDFHSGGVEAAFGRMVARARDYIVAGAILRVGLAHRFSAPWSQDPLAFYRSLRRGNPSPYLFFLDYVDFQQAGSSPEI